MLKKTYLNELEVRKPFVVSVSQRGEEPRLHNPVYSLKLQTQA
jgi:electron transfer flavoprotein alpha/beta subunit